jgi:hypothetical protein
MYVRMGFVYVQMVRLFVYHHIDMAMCGVHDLVSVCGCFTHDFNHGSVGMKVVMHDSSDVVPTEIKCTYAMNCCFL